MKKRFWFWMGISTLLAGFIYAGSLDNVTGIDGVTRNQIEEAI
jgi:hypothetical protein